MLYAASRIITFVDVTGWPKRTSIANAPQQIIHRLRRNPNTNLSRILRSLNNKKLQRYPGIVIIDIPITILSNSNSSTGKFFSPQLVKENK
jgi:hypothetical protein